MSGRSRCWIVNACKYESHWRCLCNQSNISNNRIKWCCRYHSEAFEESTNDQTQIWSKGISTGNHYIFCWFLLCNSFLSSVISLKKSMNRSPGDLTPEPPAEPVEPVPLMDEDLKLADSRFDSKVDPQLDRIADQVNQKIDLVEERLLGRRNGEIWVE